MFTYILPLTGLLVLAFFLYKAFKSAYSTSKCITYITLGVFFSTFFMVLPTHWEGAEELEVPLAYQIFSAVNFSFDTLKAKQDFAQIESIALTGVLRWIYLGINYISFIAAPLLASSLILSLFGNMGERMKYQFSFSKKCHVFSVLNPNSLELAKGIRERGKGTVVFCNTKDVGEPLVTKARKFGFITLYLSCESLKISRRFQKYEFYLISPKEDENIRLAEALILKHRDQKKRPVIVNAFARSGTNIALLEEFLHSEKNCASGKKIVRHEYFQMRFIDEIALFCSDLMYQYPLYASAKPDGLISLMIVGFGSLGERMLKTALWCGQITGYHLKIRVYDKSASQKHSKLLKACPELSLPEYDIKFIETDINSVQFEKDIKESLDATYVVLSTGQDEMNINTAEYLYRVFRKSSSFEKTPPIFARVRESTKSSNLTEENSFLENRNIHIFGTTETIFRQRSLFNTELEHLAFAIHLCYFGALNEPVGSSYYKEVLHHFYTREYDRRSSMATALHIPSKLVSCGVLKPGDSVLDGKISAKFESYISDEVALLELAKNEHDRWNAFMRSEGYRKASIAQMKEYAHKTGSHKDDHAKLHPCITAWEELDLVAEEYNELKIGKKPVDFQKYDFDIVKKIPEILRMASLLDSKE